MFLPSPSPCFLLASCGNPEVSGPTSRKEKLRLATILLVLGIDNKSQHHLPFVALSSQSLLPSVRPGKWPESSEVTLLSQEKLEGRVGDKHITKGGSRGETVKKSREQLKECRKMGKVIDNESRKEQNGDRIWICPNYSSNLVTYQGSKGMRRVTFKAGMRDKQTDSYVTQL